MRMNYLNAGFLFVATFLFGYAIFSATPAVLMQNAEDALAAVGVSAAVTKNQYNSIAEQLVDKEKRLEQREQTLALQEQAAASDPSGKYGFYSLCVSILLFILVGINFYFDARRGRRSSGNRLSVDLR